QHSGCQCFVSSRFDVSDWRGWAHRFKQSSPGSNHAINCNAPRLVLIALHLMNEIGKQRGCEFEAIDHWSCLAKVIHPHVVETRTCIVITIQTYAALRMRRVGN